MAGICTTAYVAGAVPETSLRQTYEKHALEATLRIALANKGILSSALFAAAGKDGDQAIQTFQQILGAVITGDPDGDAAAVLRAELLPMRLIRLSACWSDTAEIRQTAVKAMAKVLEDPSKVPVITETDFTAMRKKFREAHPELRFDGKVEPHRRFVETLKRDVLLHGRVPFVELTRMYVRADGPIAQVSGLQKDIDELIKVTKEDLSKPVRGEDCLPLCARVPGHSEV